MSQTGDSELDHSCVNIISVESQLFSAVEENDRSRLRELILSNHCDPRFVRNEKKETLLHIASKLGLLDIVRTLVEVYQLCPLEVDQFSTTSCHLACHFQHLHILAYFFGIGGCTYIGASRSLHLPRPARVPGEFSLHMLQAAASSQSVLMTRFVYSRMYIKVSDNTKLNLFHDSLNMIGKIFESRVSLQNVDFKYVRFATLCCGNNLNTLKLYQDELVNFTPMDSSQESLLNHSILEAACRLDKTDIVSYLTKTKGLCPNQEPPPEINEKTTLQPYSHSDCVEHTYSPLHAAMLSGNVALVRKIISMSADFYHEVISRLTTDHGTLLHLACVSGKLELVELVKQEFQCDINAQNKQGNTPLHVACEWGWLEIVQFLVASGCNVNILNNCGHTPLTTAIKHSRIKIFVFLFSRDSVSFNVKTADTCETSLHLACCCHHSEFALALLNDPRYTISLDAIDKFGDTPLFNACRLGSIEVVRKLVAKPGCTRLMVNDITKETPAHIACRNDRLDILKVLLTEGVSEPLPLNFRGESLLHIACYNDAQETIDFLIENEISNLNISCYTVQSPVHIACRHGNVETAKKLLLSGNCKITDTDSNGNTVLHYICQRQQINPGMIKFLSEEIEANQMLDRKNAYGDNALQLIIKHDGVQILHCLSKYLNLQKLNKVLHFVDENNNTPLHLAFGQKRSLTLKYLLNNQALAEGVSKALCIQNLKKKSPLLISCETEYIHLLFKSPHLSYKCVSKAVALQDEKGNNVIHYLINEVLKDLRLLTITISTFQTFMERFQHRDIVSVLCMKNKDNHTPLDLLITQASSRMSRYKELVKNMILCLAESPLSAESIISVCSITNSKGETLIHTAARNNFLNTVKLLVQRKMCDVTTVDNTGRTALHHTCMCYPSEISVTTIYLLCQQGCSAHTIDKQGHSPVSYLLKTFNVSLLQALISKGFCHPTETVETVQICAMISTTQKYSYVIHRPVKSITIELPLLHSMFHNNWSTKDDLLSFIAQHKHSLKLRDSFGNTILHLGSSYHLFEKNLLKLSDCDLNIQNKEGNTPLHLACATGHREIIKKLIATEKCGKSLSLQNKYGHTPLYYLSNRELINLLVMNGADPKDVADTERVKHLTDMFKAVKDKHPLNLTVTALVLGNSLAGKTTLLKSLTKAYSWDQVDQPTIRQVDEKCERTAGIEISEYEVVKERALRVLFYDFAGHPEFHSTHHILLENRLSFSKSQQDSPILFVIVVDITAPDKLKQLIYWAKFIENCQLSCITGRKPEVIIIGSHVDKYSSSDDLYRKMKHSLSQTMERMSDSIDLVEYPILLNCCEPKENELQKVKLLLVLSTEKLKNHTDLDNRCHLIFSYLYEHYPAYPVKFSEFYEKLQKWKLGGITTLPFTRSKVIELLTTMHHMQHILLIGLTSEACDFWILTPKAQSCIFREVHGLLFAGEDFDLHPSIVSNVGVISSLEIKDMFPNFEYEMLQQFLVYSELCKKIDEEEVLELIQNGASNSTKEQKIGVRFSSRQNPDLPMNVNNLSLLDAGEGSCNIVDYFFFPGLVNETREKRMLQWKCTDKYSICSGWSLECKQDNFFNALFLQVLLLRLIFQFAATSLPDSVLHRRCVIWKNGVFWSVPGVEMLVEVTNQNQTVIVLVRCFKDTELEAIKLRSAVLKEVFKVKAKHSPATETIEFVICNPSLDENGSLTKPVKKVAVNEIAGAITKGVKYVQDNSFQHHRIIEDLLCFEPYAGIANKTMMSLFDPDEARIKIPDDILSTLFNETESVAEPRHIEQFKERIDSFSKPVLYEDLRNLFDEYSIFHGRDPKVSSVHSLLYVELLLNLPCTFLYRI